MNDRVSDLDGVAGPRRQCAAGGTGTSAEVIRFILPPAHRGGASTDFPTIAFRATVPPEDLAATHADTAPCEIVPFEYDET